jgi:hypothetical protein
MNITVGEPSCIASEMRKNLEPGPGLLAIIAGLQRIVPIPWPRQTMRRLPTVIPALRPCGLGNVTKPKEN